MNNKYIEFLEERIRLASSKETLAAYTICLKQYKETERQLGN